MAPKRKRKRDAAAESDAAASMHRTLVQHGTKTSLATVIDTLANAGWLARTALDTIAVMPTKTRLTTAANKHAKAMTPYGPVMQQMHIGLPILPRWTYIHPLALVYYIGSISITFARMMRDCCVIGVPCNIIIYIDENVPGNPLRPEKKQSLASNLLGNC